MARHTYIVYSTATNRVLCNRRFSEEYASWCDLTDASYKDWQQYQPIGFSTVAAADQTIRKLYPDELYVIIPVRCSSEPPRYRER